MAHRRYLSSLVQYLFLTEVPFTSALRSFLTSVDHLIALVTRLETVQRNLDLEMDEGVVDALANYGQEERSLLQDLREAREEVETGIKEIVARLRDIDDSRSGEGRKVFDLSTTATAASITTSIIHPSHHGRSGPFSTAAAGGDQNMYIPRKAAGVDRLLMKLDFGSLNDGSGAQYFQQPPSSAFLAYGEE